MDEAFEVRFQEIFSTISEMYDKNPSPFVFELWFNSLKRFDMQAIDRAFSIHVQDPDNGKFMPKPADIVRIIEGSGQDSAFVAWTKFEKGLSSVGTYETVVFDDPLIHAVVSDMGGWIRLGQTTDKEIPFVKNEFCRRYQAFKSQCLIPEYPPTLIGITEGENRVRGFAEEIPRPTFIGDKSRANAVLLGGSDKPSLQISYGPEPVNNGLLELKKIEA